jgi:uncharacterized protein
MDDGTIETMSVAQRLRELLETEDEVVMAVLFGSWARGTAGDRSDIDVAVRVRGELDPALLHRLERALGRTLDLVDADAAPPQLRFEIARDGVMLVERRRSAWADFRARAMVDWWDWAPVARRIHGAAVRRLERRTADGPQ